jgi:hypothetical protein
MEFYTATKENEILSFTGKWLEPENIIFCFFIYSYVNTMLGSFLPLPSLLSLPTSRPTPSLPGRNCSALISNFVEERI